MIEQKHLEILRTISDICSTDIGRDCLKMAMNGESVHCFSFTGVAPEWLKPFVLQTIGHKNIGAIVWSE